MKDLSAVTPQDVRTAVRLCDELGEKEFLARYGFGRSTRYGLHVDGAVYPSKAILGVAHEFATGTALTSDSFFGGGCPYVPSQAARAAGSGVGVVVGCW